MEQAKKIKLFELLAIIALIVVVVIVIIFITKNGESLSTNLKIGEAIYVNPETGKTCNKKNAVSKTGTKTGCMKWYIYDKNDNGTYQLILDHNTTAAVAFTKKEEKTYEKVLKEDTKNWKSRLKARLITANEVAKITGADLDNTIKWNSEKEYVILTNDETNETYDISTDAEISWFYLDGCKNRNKKTYDNKGWQTPYANSNQKSSYGWLFDNTNGCLEYGCNVEEESSEGYWTSDSVTYQEFMIWNVNKKGMLNIEYNGIENLYGIRPVITLK